MIGTGSSASLVENNISVDNNKPIASIASGGGNVIAYNYVDNAVHLEQHPGGRRTRSTTATATFTHHDLIEGNWTPNIGSATTHGNSGWHTHFRNYATGRNSSGNVTANLRAVGVDAWTHDQRLRGQRAPRAATCYQTNALLPERHAHLHQLGNNFMASAGTGTTATPWPTSSATGTGTTVSNGQTVWANGAKTLPPSLYLTGQARLLREQRTWPWVQPAHRADRGHPPGQGALRREHAERGALRLGRRGQPG